MHKTTNCQSTASCKTCKKRHHSLLNFERHVNTSPSTSGNVTTNTVIRFDDRTPPEIITPTQALASFSRFSTEVLVSTAVVEVLDIRGYYQKVRAIIDTGSQTSLITQKCANRLGLRKYKINSEIQGIGDVGINDNFGCVSLTLRPINKIVSHLFVNAVILTRMCSDLPISTLAKEDWKHNIKNFNLADPEFHKPGSIVLLLGADILRLIILGYRVVGKNRHN